MPDILAGEPIIDFNDPKVNIMEWLGRHGPESWIPSVDKVVEVLKTEGVTRFGTTGYCFGAPPAFYLACKGESVATVVSHPSRLDVPADIEVRTYTCITYEMCLTLSILRHQKYKTESKAPLLINSCEVDQQFPPEKQAITDEILGGGKFAPGYERTYWDGCVHGFAVRGDLVSLPTA